MNRNQWRFAYTADKLLAAAKTKRDWHTSRLNWWSAKNLETEKKIREEGLEIDRSVAHGQVSTVSNSYRQPAVQIKNDLLTDFHETQSKVLEHQGKIKDYDAWVQVLETQGQASFDLQQDDWLFFFGK